MISIAQDTSSADPWDQLRFLEGKWDGRGDGVSGLSTVKQNYSFILNNQFLEMSTISVFPPTKKSPKGEIHRDVGFISYDKATEKFILRAFYGEGFVNTYQLTEISDDEKTFLFETISVENGPPGTRAKLIIKKLSSEVIEVGFHVAFGENDFTCFNTNRLKIKK